MFSENLDTLFAIVGVLLLGAISWLIATVKAHTKTKQVALADSDKHQSALSSLETDMDAKNAETQQLWISSAEQETQIRHLSEQVHLLQTEKSALQLQTQTLSQQKSEADQEIKVLQTEQSKDREAHTERLKIVDTLKDAAIEAAKAASVESATKLSSKLLDDHKRETVEAKKETEERVKQTTDALVNQITEVSKTIHALNLDVSSNRNTMDTVMRALSSPGGAGQYSELGLEKALSDFGLLKGRDFFMQPQIDDSKLRPDALVYLPGDTVLVIDSKSSKFLLGIEEAQSDDEESEAFASLANTMNKHLTSLSSKNYKAEVYASYKKSMHIAGNPQIMSIMFVPSEGAIEKITIADPKFPINAAKLNIVVAGPAGLNGIIGMSKLQLDMQRQSENQERIVAGLQRFIESVGMIVQHTENVGKGLKSASSHYSKLSKSMNSGLLKRVQELEVFGVTSNKNKQIPKSIPTFTLLDHKDDNLIEGDAAEVEQSSFLTDQTQPDE